jgi:hypothetical protein
MRKLEDGAGEGQGGGGGGRPEKPENNPSSVSRSYVKWLYAGTALTAFFFLAHLLFLFLVEPLKLLSLSKTEAYAYSGIPLIFGIVCFLFTLLSFWKISPRLEFHVVVLLGAIVFGSLNIQGAVGIARYLAKGHMADWVRAIE